MEGRKWPPGQTLVTPWRALCLWPRLELNHAATEKVIISIIFSFDSSGNSHQILEF